MIGLCPKGMLPNVPQKYIVSALEAPSSLVGLPDFKSGARA